MGMIKMYRAEVLNKLPVMQHFLFGSLLPLNFPESLQLGPSSQTQAIVFSHDHSHPHTSESGDGGGASQLETGWGDCCGIPIPSAFAAAQTEKKGVGILTRADAGPVSGSLAGGRKALASPVIVDPSQSPTPMSKVPDTWRGMHFGNGVRPVPFD